MGRRHPAGQLLVEVTGLQIDLQGIRRHYAGLSVAELLALRRDDLTDEAQKCYDEELERRGLPEAEEAEMAPSGADYEQEPFDAAVDPDWLQEAVCACSFESHAGGSAASDAENARAVLQEAGIPCQISAAEISAAGGGQPAQHEYRVMVPGPLNLKAASILDKEVFNPQLDADWRLHFESLTDGELGALNPDVICAGLFDRIARLKRAYNDEVTRRFRHRNE